MSIVTRRRPAPAQDAIFEFIRDYKRGEDGNSPTYQEIAEALGVTTATAYNTVLRLVRRGVVKINKRGKISIGGTYIPPEDFGE